MKNEKSLSNVYLIGLFIVAMMIAAARVPAEQRWDLMFRGVPFIGTK